MPELRPQDFGFGTLVSLRIIERLIREVPEWWTCIIGVDGKLKSIDRNVQAGEHGKDIAAKLDELKIPKKD